MRIGGIDYGVESPWEIDVPDDAIVIENTAESRISAALTDVPRAIRDAIRNPLGARPLADQVNSSSKVALILNDWMGISVHAVPVVLEELRSAGVDEQNVRMVIAGGLHPKVSRDQLYLSKVGQDIKPPYPSPYHILPPTSSTDSGPADSPAAASGRTTQPTVSTWWSSA